MLDSFSSLKSRNRLTAKKKINKNDWFFKDHLINAPIMPGVLLEECMFQSAVCFLKLNKINYDEEFLLFNSNSTFLNQIQNSCSLIIETQKLKEKNNFIFFSVENRVKNKIICKSKFLIKKINV